MSDGSVPDADLAIRLRNLRKVYRLYRKPSYRIRDVLGILPDNPRYFDEHVALHDVSLDIRRGEKVAIIGRNGAGKSTLLRLITRVIQPTSGTLDTRGSTQALLSIGAGFHPELTGRQNVLAYLAHFGISGAQARRTLEEIIEFAELEEYIDQPTKTYSTGMGMRLMFSASIMFVPELLVIDEVLGVGDAYFQGKSFERIREICSGRGTTLLLVTHDIYAATLLCERSIWIDQGAVLIDADSPTVLKAYEASIRQQEEARLRKKAFLSLRRLADDRSDLIPLLIELRCPDNAPHVGGIGFARIALYRGDVELGMVPLVGDLAPGDVGGSIVAEGGTWGEIIEIGGRQAREMKNFGSSMHKVAVSFLLPRELAGVLDELSIEVETASAVPYRLTAWRIGQDLDNRGIGEIAGEAADWVTFRLPLAGGVTAIQSSAASEMVVRAAETHGSGRITVTGIRLLDSADQETFQLVHGEPASVVFDYQINDPELNDDCQIVMYFRRNGTEDIARVYCQALAFDGRSAPKGQIIARFDRLSLGSAEYSLTSLIAEKGYYEEKQTIFYSINPKVYWAVRNILDFKVTTDHYIPQGTGVVIETSWSVRPTPTPHVSFDHADLPDDTISSDVALSLFSAKDAVILASNGGLTVQTRPSNFAYALSTPALAREDVAIEPNVIVIEGLLEEGAVSVGILDADRDEFVASGPQQQPGPFQYFLAIDSLPDRYSVILSNHQTAKPGVSRFTLHRVRLARREPLVSEIAREERG